MLVALSPFCSSSSLVLLVLNFCWLLERLVTVVFSWWERLRFHRFFRYMFDFLIILLWIKAKGFLKKSEKLSQRATVGFVALNYFLGKMKFRCIFFPERRYFVSKRYLTYSFFFPEKLLFSCLIFHVVVESRSNL